MPPIPETDEDGNPLTMAWLETYNDGYGGTGTFQDPIDLDDLAGEVRRLQSMGYAVRIHWIYDRPKGNRYDRLRNKEFVF